MESSKVAAFVPPLNWYKYNPATEATYIKTAGYCRKSGEDASTQIDSNADVIDLLSRHSIGQPKVTFAECQALCDADPLCTHFDYNSPDMPDWDSGTSPSSTCANLRSPDYNLQGVYTLTDKNGVYASLSETELGYSTCYEKEHMNGAWTDEKYDTKYLFHCIEGATMLGKSILPALAMSYFMM